MDDSLEIYNTSGVLTPSSSILVRHAPLCYSDNCSETKIGWP